MNKSIIRLADEEQYCIECNKRNSILRNRMRPTVELSATGSKGEIAEIRAALSNPANTENMVLIYHGDNPELTPEQLEGVAQEELQAYTIPGEITEKEVAIIEETPTLPAEYAWQLTVQLGQRLYGETV